MTPEQFLLFADPLPEPTLLLADDGLIYAGNRAVAEWLGISVSWLQGKRLAEVVVESPDEVSRYLRLCCRSRSLVLGAMRLHINGSEEIACRMEGSLICPKQEGAAAVLMLRLTPKESAGGQFVALNQRIEELGREVQRRKRAEEEQRASADRLSLALSAADLGDWSWDAASDMVKLSVRAAEVFDIPPGSHITWTAMQDLLHPADQERARQEVERVVAERVQYDIEYRANRRDGTHVWVGVLGRAIYDASDQVVGMYGVVQDITERKRHEEALRQSVEELQTLMDTLPIGVFVAHDPDCRTITGNAAAHALMRTQASKLSKSAPAGEATMPFRVCRNGVEIPPDQLPVQRAARGEFVRDEEVDDLFEDGTAVHTLMSAAPLYDGHGRVRGAVATVLDVTERKQAQQASERLAAIVESSDDAIFSKNLGGIITSWNRGAQQHFGYTAQEAIGQPGTMLFPPDRLDEEAGILESIRRGERIESYETVRLRKDGTTLDVSLTISAIVDSQGRIVGSSKIARDITERKGAEQALRDEEQRRRLATETSAIGIWEWNLITNAVRWDAQLFRIYGIAPTPDGWVQYTDWSETVHPEDVQEQHEILQDTARRAGKSRREFRIRRQSDGECRHIESVETVRTNDKGETVWVVGTNLDVTERKRLAEENEALLLSSLRQHDKLSESEERLRLALDAGRMGVWDWNVRTGDLAWSDSIEPLHGLAPGTFGGTFDHFQQLIHPDDREAVNAAIRQALETGGEFYVEFRNVWHNGSIHWIAGSGKVFPGDDGQPLRMIGIGMDVTQRKRAQQTARFLADASAALAVLVDFDSTLQKVASLAVPSFADWATVDLAEPDGTLRRVSVSHIDPAKVQLAHEVHRRFPPDPTAPQGVWTILRTGRAEIVPEITDKMLVQSIKEDELLSILRELGLKSYIGVPLTVRGKTLGVITFINAESGHQYDRTDLAMAEDLASRAAIAIENAQLYRELRQDDQRKDEFLATLAHELRNPLAPIRNGLQVLKLAGGSGEMVNEARTMMERQLGQMVRLVDDLLDVSRITRNKLDLKKKRITLASVVHSAVETSRPLMEQSGHIFSLTLPSNPVYLDADLTRMAQVFSNLLNNSAKYTMPGGRIALTGEVAKGEAVLRVRDNGMGIPSDALPRVFELFSQVDRNMERAQGGLGIGLSLVRRLVEMHGGMVEARSEGPGLGSEFVVRLPILNAMSQSSNISATDQEAIAGPKRRILVVDDNHDSATSLGMMLELMGNEIQTAHDGLAAVDNAEQFRPDMILLDIGLPKLNGYEACRRVRQQPWSKGMVIVALTGWGQEEDRRRSREAGFDHHLVKPVEIMALQQLLAERPKEK